MNSDVSLAKHLAENFVLAADVDLHFATKAFVSFRCLKYSWILWMAQGGAAHLISFVMCFSHTLERLRNLPKTIWSLRKRLHVFGVHRPSAVAAKRNGRWNKRRSLLFHTKCIQRKQKPQFKKRAQFCNDCGCIMPSETAPRQNCLDWMAVDLPAPRPHPQTSRECLAGPPQTPVRACVHRVI
mgnify:CR=1 FL=1